MLSIDNVTFHPVAADQLVQIYVWYENREIGLGERFFDDIEKTAIFLADNPTINQSCYKEYCRQLLHTFPYAVYYEALADKIHIISVVHTSRHPETWKNDING